MVKRSVSILLPAYNEASGIKHFLDQELSPTLKNLPYNFNLIIVNDGSTDDTLAEIESSSAIKQFQTTIISFTKNFGKEVSMSAGLKYSGKTAAVIMLDCDGQHPVSAISKMLAKWENGAKIVTAIDLHKHTKHKLGSKLFYKMMRLTNSPGIHEGAMDFRLLDRSVVTEFNRFTEHNRITRGLIDWLGFPQEYIKVSTLKRASGTPTYSTKKLAALALDSFVSMSTTPLVFFGYVGIFITLVSLPLGLFILIEQYILGDPLGLDWSGAVAMSLLISFLVGLVLISQSITALYISHIHAEAKNRPLYVIDHSKSSNLKGA